ncbi:MAG: glycosyltransferase family 9 protein [Gemmatimonadales bacterium]
MAPRVLIVRLSSMGDILLTTPLLRAIRTRHPEARITYVTKTTFLPLLEHNRRIDELIGYDPIKPLAPLGRYLAQGGFTHRLDLHGSLRSRRLRWMVPGAWQSYPKHRLARTILIRTKRNRYRDRRHVVERYFDAARDLDVTPDQGSLEFFLHREALDRADRFLAERGLGQDRALVAVCPGAAHATKQWPTRRWQELVTHLTTRGSDVVVLGGPAEARLGEDVAAAGAEQAASVAGAVPIGVSGAILKRARCAVSGDTGLMHLATAVGAPVVALFGPTVEAFGFFPYHARATVVQRDLPCRPCSPMGGQKCPLGHHRCLTEISPEEVFEAVRRLPR